MNRVRAIMVALGLAVALQSGIALAQHDLKTAAASAGGISVKVEVLPIYHVKWQHLVAHVAAWSVRRSFTVPCLNPYRDFRYQLTDASGKAVAPADISHASWGGSHINTGLFPNPCGFFTRGTYAILLSRLFPNLQPGIYTLRVEFAPVTTFGVPHVVVLPVTFEVSAT